MKKKYLGIILIITILFTMVGCDEIEKEINRDNSIDESEIVVDNSQDINIEPTYGGELILPLTTVASLNPLTTENIHYYYFSKLIYEGLFDFDENLQPKAVLAESYNMNYDGTSISIKLRDDTYWHDGTKLSAEDVVFTVNTIKASSGEGSYGDMFNNSGGPSGQLDIRRIINARVTGNNSVEITFDRPISNNLEVLTFPIIPSHIFNGSVQLALSQDDYPVMGTGPYKFNSYEKMKEVKLDANENYRNGKPYIDKISGRILGSKEDLLTAFETGQINMATTIGIDWEKYRQNTRIKVLEFVSPNYEFLGFNFNNPIFQGEDGKAIRKAIAYSIDRQSIINTAFLGHGTQIDSPIHPDSWLIADSSNTYGYNLELAKKELADLGFVDSDKNGIVENRNGENIKLRILTNSYNNTRLKMAEMIRDDLIKLGIDIELDVEEIKENPTEEDIENQWIMVNDKISKGNYDMVLLGWEMSVVPELSFAFHSSQRGRTNVIGYSNEEMDQLLEKVHATGNRDEKLSNYEELQDFIVEEIPYYSLFFKNKGLLIDKKIGGDINPVFFNPYNGIEKAFIINDSKE